MEKLPVVEIFNSIQGEGIHTGKPAFFIRLAGCDVCCTWCDEKIAWDAATFPLRQVDEIVHEVRNSGANTVVVTGGEPFRYDLNALTAELEKISVACMAETSGTGVISGAWHWITMSPKQQQPPLSENYKQADELKVVIQKESDFAWAEHNAKFVRPDTVLYLQPEWSCFHEILPLIIRYIKINPHWRLSVQMHKFLNIP